ncbi:ribosome-binding factor A [Candidatus Nomurabacteria bacterium]|nr:ribosome-binding factor A [Candidatus Kaiserbacteria bacterium]MCB9814781.1 ribosome-binding factor A [Candidatus Nomurabacteria bacterium]
MPHTDRRTKVAMLLKELAATFIQQEANANPLITVTNVNISPDLSQATIFFTTIPDGREGDALIFLKRNATNLRNYLKKKMRIKAIPHLEFMVDAGERHRQHMDELVHEIEEKKKE